MQGGYGGRCRVEQERSGVELREREGSGVTMSESESVSVKARLEYLQ